MADARSFDDLRRYWDAIARGEPASPGDLDPDLAATIKRLHAFGDGPPPDPAYAQRLRETIMHASTLPLPTPLSPTPNGVRSVAGGIAAPRSLPLAPRREPRRFWSLLATAALIALTIASGFAAIGGLVRNAARPEKPSGIPALIGTPSASLPPGVTEDTTLFDQRIEAIPPGATWTGVERYTFAPGETWPQGTTPGAGYGPMLYRVEAGVMTVRAAGPFRLTRAATGEASQAPKDTDIVLAQGDVVFLPFGVTSMWRNSGATSAKLMDAGIAYVSNVSPKDVDVDYNYNAYPIRPPRAPAAFALRRLTLAPGAAVAVAPTSGVQLLGVESGKLMLVQAGAAGAARSETRQVSVPTMNGSPNLIDLNGDRLAIQSLRNDGDAPTSILLLTITPIEPATPSAGAATPAAGLPPGVTADRLVLRDAFALPPEATIVEVDRETLPPASDPSWAKPNRYNPGVGVKLYRLEQGRVTLRANGVVTLTRAGTQRQTDMPAGQTIALAAGDVVRIPANLLVTWRNLAETPAVLLSAGVTSNQTDSAPGDNATLVAEWYSFASPSSGAALTLREVTLAPGGRLALPLPPGRAWVGVESGTGAIEWAAPDDPTRVADTQNLFAGGWADVTPGQKIATGVRNPGSSPVTLAVLTISPRSPIAGTPAG
jgi:hypothetical protein